jgi:hypothetical protein
MLTYMTHGHLTSYVRKKLKRIWFMHTRNIVTLSIERVALPMSPWVLWFLLFEQQLQLPAHPLHDLH